MLGINLFWQIDVWRELRNARDAACQRYIAATERRNYFVTKLVAEIAENYYDLVALDKRLENLGQTVDVFQKSLKVAEAKKAAGRDTALAVQRFQAEVRKNQSETQIVRQEIIQAENKINVLVNRYPQPVQRSSDGFFDLTIHRWPWAFPRSCLQNRPDIRQAERELAAAGLDILVAGPTSHPRLDITGNVGYEAFNPSYLFLTPESLIGSIAGNLVVPLAQQEGDPGRIHDRQRQAIAGPLQLPAGDPHRLHRSDQSHVEGGELRPQHGDQEAAVAMAEGLGRHGGKLFQNARAEYVEVLLAQRELMEARMGLIEIKKEQLSAIVNTYQHGGGGITRHPLSQCHHKFSCRHNHRCSNSCRRCRRRSRRPLLPRLLRAFPAPPSCLLP